MQRAAVGNHQDHQQIGADDEAVEEQAEGESCKAVMSNVHKHGEVEVKRQGDVFHFTPSNSAMHQN